MKVLYVIPYDWGGLPQYTSELANAVSKYEDVVVLASKGIKTSYFSDDVEIIKIHSKRSKKSPVSEWIIRISLIKRDKNN